MIKLYQGDCLEVMAELETASFDAIITDPPYGTTACKWDSVIPFAPMWEQLKRLAKPKVAIVLFGSQPFTSALVMSNPGWFKYCWVWNKKQGGTPLNAKRQPLRITEDIAIFNTVMYNPQMRKGKYRKRGGSKKQPEITGRVKTGWATWGDMYYPTTILEFPNCSHKADRVHPTQKPVALMEYLVKTYTNEGDTVLDFTMGSGSTGVACVNLDRNFIGIELDEDYFKIAEKRIAETQQRLF